MPAKSDIQGADQNRTGVCDLTGLSGVSPRAREQVTPDWKPPRPEPKPPKPLKRTGFRRNATLASEFRFQILHEFGGRCILADLHECDGPLDPAHIIPKQLLRRRGFSEQVVYDPRNGIAACRKAHRRSDSGLERFRLELLPLSVFEFAAEHGLTDRLNSLYERSTG